MTSHTWPIETEDQIEALARECEWNNRRFMTATDYSIWCERMRKFARLAKIEEPAAPECEYCVDGLQADGETPCPCQTYPSPAPAKKEWRCFHCDEVFTDEHSAKLHFGMDQCSDPACVIKMGAEKSLLVALRKAENELADAWAAIHNESTEAAKAYYAQQSRHGEQLRAAEEYGYEIGIRDVAKSREAGIEQAARFVETRRDDYVREHGSYDHSTGVTEFPGDGEQYVYELDEIADGIRKLLNTAETIADTTRDRETSE